MPIKTIERTIDGHAVKIIQFRALKGLKIKARLVKFILPALGPIIGQSDMQTIDKDSLKGVNISSVAPKLFSSLSESLNPEVFSSLLLSLLSETFVDGQMIDDKTFDDMFIANYSLAYILAYEVVMANNFFDFGAIGNLLGDQGQVETQETPEQ